MSATVSGVFLAAVSSVSSYDGSSRPDAARMVPVGMGGVVTVPLAVSEPLRAGMAADPAGLFLCACAPDGHGAVLCRENGGL